MDPSSPRLWIAITRPDHLVAAAAIAHASRSHFASCHLLRDDSRWWNGADGSGLLVSFDKVTAISQVLTCRGLLDLPRLYRELRARQERLARLRISQNDTLVCLAGLTTLSNGLVSCYPGLRKVLCVPVQTFVRANRTYSLRQHRYTTAGWLQRWVAEPLLGIRPTIHLKPWRGGGDGARVLRPRDSLTKTFESIVLLSNDGTDGGPVRSPQMRSAPFPSLRDLPAENSADDEPIDPPRKIVFFGSPFLLVRNLSPELYGERLNACLQYLRRCFGSGHELVYRPHPAETHERAALDLRDFVVEADGEVAELYFVRHARRIAAIFSVSSTVSRTALNDGFAAYAFWRCFPFEAGAATFFESLMGRVPAAFEIRSLDQPPAPYVPDPAAKRIASFGQVMRSVLAGEESWSANGEQERPPSKV